MTITLDYLYLQLTNHFQHPAVQPIAGGHEDCNLPCPQKFRGGNKMFKPGVCI